MTYFNLPGTALRPSLLGRWRKFFFFQRFAAPLSAAILFFSVLMGPLVLANDTSLPYRNAPGFQCYHWNAQGECTDYSYFDTGLPVAPPVYKPAPAPAPRYNPAPQPPAIPASSYYFNVNTKSPPPSLLPYQGNLTPPYDYDANARLYGNCYDPYGQYDARLCRGGISVRVVGAPSTVYQNDLLTYSIYIRNDDNADHAIPVRAFLDPRTFFHSASNKPVNTRPNEVNWNSVFLRRNSSKTLSLTVRVNGYTRDGDTIRLLVQADGSQDDTTNTVRSPRYNGSRDCYDGYGRYDPRFCANNNRSNPNNCYDLYGRYDPNSCNSNGSYNNCYDSNGRYDARYCNNGNDGNSTCNGSSGTCGFSVRAYSSPIEARVGELVTYTIMLRNDDNRIRTLDVRALLDRFLSFYSATDGGSQRNSGEIRWDSVSIAPNSSRTLSLSARIDPRARIGDQLTFSVTADGDMDNVTTRVR